MFIVASTVCLFQWNNMGNIGKNDMLLWINNIIQIWYRASQSTGQGYFLQYLHFLINIPIVCFLSNLIFSYHFHINIYHWQIYQSLDLKVNLIFNFTALLDHISICFNLFKFQIIFPTQMWNIKSSASISFVVCSYLSLQ